MAVAPPSSEAGLLKTRVPINMLSDKDRAALLGKINVEYLKEGEYLFRQGDTDSNNVYLLSGKVDLLLNDKVVDTITDNLETARFALAHQFPRKFSARVKSPVKFVSINSQLLSGLLEAESPTVGAGEADDDWMTQLLSSSAVQHIPPANIQNVMMRMERVDVKIGDEIVKQGDEGEYFFLINKGCCAVIQKRGDDVEPEELAQLRAGDSFGEEALLSDSLRVCSVVMLTDGVLFRLGKEDFITFIKRPLTNNVDYKKACKIVESGGTWLDVREPIDHERNNIEGSVNIPLNTLRFKLDSLELDRQYVIYCADGNQSSVAAFLLLERGIDVAVLKGGINGLSPADSMQSNAPTPLQQDSDAGSSDVTVDILKLTQERDEAQNQIKQLEKRLAKSTEKYEQVQSKLVANVTMLKQAVRELKAKLVATQASSPPKGSAGDNAELLQRVAELEHEKSEQDKQIQKLESDYRQLNAELEILLEASEENDQAAQAEVTELKAQLADLQR